MQLKIISINFNRKTVKIATENNFYTFQQEDR